MSNRKFLQGIYPDFKNWEEENNVLLDNFSKFCSYFEEFLFSCVLVNSENSNKIIELIPHVLSNCNDLEYNKYGEVEAYSIMHLLDRYHRFQLVSQILIREGLLPLRKKPSDILDIGTGPANVLFALEDRYCSLRKYGKEKDIEILQSFEFSFDYVEKSKYFRDWLHHFTEFVYGKKKAQMHIPYNHGSFSDFYILNFKEEKNQLQQALIRSYMEECHCSRSFAQHIIDHEEVGWKDAYRYNMVIFSNFLTEKEQITKSREQIISVCKALRNGGVILVVGAREGDYPKIYENLCKEVESFHFMKLKYESDENETLCQYSFNDDFGKRIDMFYENLITHLDSLGVQSDSYLDFKKKIKKPQKKGIKWKILVFRKQFSHYKNSKN